MYRELIGFVLSVSILMRGELCTAQAQTAQTSAGIDAELAATYFEEMDAIAKQDDGRLWGVSLAGPAIFVIPETRAIATNTQVPGDAPKLEQHGKVFLGTLPEDLPIANTSVRWADQSWTMITWPLPTDAIDRRVLMAHESWHRIQQDIPIESCNVSNAHLDEMNARICLQMEWLALAKALETNKDQRRQAVLDALVFRAIRRLRFPEAAKEENQMELHEGLAEYTGIRLGAGEAAERYAIQSIRAKPGSWPTFVRSFAYLSGPGYGLLLDEQDTQWRRELVADSDLGEMLRHKVKLELPKSLPDYARNCIAKYGAQPLIEAERNREEQRQESQRRLKALLVDGPILELPLEKMQMSFDPRKNVPLEGEGTVFGNLVVSDSWGKLSSTGEAMISTDYKRLVVPVGDSFDPASLQGADWSLELAKKGWLVVPSEKKNSWNVRPAN